MPLKDKQQSKPPGAEAVPAQDAFSLISNQKLLQLYANILKCRLLDERIRVERDRLPTSGDANRDFQFPPRGREAALVGVLNDLLPDDTLAAPPLDLISRFVIGAPLVDVFRLLRQGFATSRKDPTRNDAASPTGANPANENKRISVLVSGGGDAEQSAWAEALRLASLHRLPTIFVSWKPRKAPTLDFPIMTVDACDVVAVYRVSSESIAHARQGFGPTFVECQQWKGPDATSHPLMNMENYLNRKGLFTKGMKAEIIAGFRAELDAAVVESLGPLLRTPRKR